MCVLPAPLVADRPYATRQQRRNFRLEMGLQPPRKRKPPAPRGEECKVCLAAGDAEDPPPDEDPPPKPPEDFPPGRPLAPEQWMRPGFSWAPGLSLAFRPREGAVQVAR